MKAIRRTIALFFVLGLTAVAQVSPVGKQRAASGTMMPHPSHANGAALTYAELKNTAPQGGYSLAGVGYFLNAPEGPDGQPVNAPFPKSLALWHRHENICVLPHLENPHGLSENQCREQGGHFIAKTQWLVHAWIWKDNPTGIFSPENPAV